MKHWMFKPGHVYKFTLTDNSTLEGVFKNKVKSKTFDEGIYLFFDTHDPTQTVILTNVNENDQFSQIPLITVDGNKNITDQPLKENKKPLDLTFLTTQVTLSRKNLPPEMVHYVRSYAGSRTKNKKRPKKKQKKYQTKNKQKINQTRV
jgi:hypothetical protein